MTPTDMCRQLIEKSDMQQKDVAQKMGWTQQSISNKFRRNSLSADEFVKMLGVLGYEIKLVESDTNEEICYKRKGIGDRLKMMVNGVKYDTFKADAICHTEQTDSIFDELYKDDEGRYFVAHYVMWEGGVSSISPIGEEDAKKFSEKYKD